MRGEGIAQNPRILQRMGAKQRKKAWLSSFALAVSDRLKLFNVLPTQPKKCPKSADLGHFSLCRDERLTIIAIFQKNFTPIWPLESAKEPMRDWFILVFQLISLIISSLEFSIISKKYNEYKLFYNEYGKKERELFPNNY